MIGILRAGVLGFVILTVVYIAVSIYSRSMRREKLENAWDSDPANEGAAPDARDTYIEGGMKAYHSSLRRKLILLVYILPLTVVMVTAYLVNSQ